MIDLDPNPKPRKRKILERDVEAYLVKRVAALGGVAEKFTSPSRRSVPDRIVLWPRKLICYDDPFNFGDQARLEHMGIAVFVECKAPGEKPTSQQSKDHERRRAMGFRVFVVDSYEAVDKFLERYP